MTLSGAHHTLMLSLSKYEIGKARTVFSLRAHDLGQAMPVLPSSPFDKLRMRVSFASGLNMMGGQGPAKSVSRRRATARKRAERTAWWGRGEIKPDSRGLDPGIQGCRLPLDCRVTPGNDSCEDTNC
jgi:hypothetical protein